MTDKLDTKSLNEKLLKFAGLELRPELGVFGGLPYRHGGWFYKGEYVRSTTPDLVHDLNAQAKWLYPELRRSHLGIIMTIDSNGATAHLYSRDIPISITNKTLSIAFALAVEEYINKSK